MDGIYAEHLKYAAENLHILLSMVLKFMLIHAHLLPMLMSTKVSPIVKATNSLAKSYRSYLFS